MKAYKLQYTNKIGKQVVIEPLTEQFCYELGILGNLLGERRASPLLHDAALEWTLTAIEIPEYIKTEGVTVASNPYNQMNAGIAKSLHDENLWR